MQRGLACLAASYDGNTFDDEYLRYVYPEERLLSPLPGYRVTYRNLDAYFIVLMVRQAGADPGPARALFDRAEALATALAPVWRSEGLYNVRRNATQGGIALDTYAILAYLKRDPEMARTILSTLDGDGWLPANLYHGDETFRTVADESWAARALIATGVDPAASERAARSLCDAAKSRLARERGAASRANLSLHVLDMLRDLETSAAPPRGEDVAWRSAARESFVTEAIRSLEDGEALPDTLTLANLAGTLSQEPKVEADSLAPIVRDLIGRQEDDGCWRQSLEGTRGAGRVFATARMILLLQLWRTVRMPAGA